MKSVSATFTWLRPLITLTFVSTLFQGCLLQCLTRDDTRPFTNPAARQNLYKGQHDFSLALLREVDKVSPAENVFFSPYSTYHALLLAYFTSAGQTEQSLSQALRLGANQDKVDIMQAYRFDKLRRTAPVSADQPYEFNSANRIYVSNQAHIRDCMEELFMDELQKTDFQTNPTAARRMINSWVETQTRNMIKDLIPPDGIDQMTNLVLVNAAFFRGLWEYRFDAANTQPMIFYVTPSENTMVDMMTQEGTFNHDVSEKLGAHILELPYKGSSASMFILLPPFVRENGVENILANLNAETFGEIVKEGNLFPKKVIVAMPKFSMERTIEMAPILERIGVGDLFTDSADLSTLTGTRNITLGRAIHKARIEVTEEGTKAAAATALFTFRSSRPAEPAQFICNHPFVYVIYDKQSQAILFSGIFRRP
ncbi:Serpin 88Ea [Carabus blaptoides fortunei]